MTNNRLLLSALKRVTFLWAMLTFSTYAADSHDQDRTHYYAPFASQAPKVDGVANESVWQLAKWQQLDNRWLGPEYSKEDFQGRYKVVWTKNKLYLMAEIIDDILIDSHRDPLSQYWDDDCLEIFIDEDFSGGDHQFNHNAFAYHFSLDNQAIDIGTDKQARSYSHHVESQWKQADDKVIWELSIDIYTDEYQDLVTDNQSITLSAGKIMGLMVAYCDNDGSELRENFIGSESAPGPEPDRGWKDAGLFGKLILAK
ncbi:MAG: sugar-binding protein [Litorilituus sp.]|nr:sugar-binding protein [Litorilituus sp.]